MLAPMSKGTITAPADLVLERQDQDNETAEISSPSGTVLITPPIDADYWAYRVRVADGQAIIGFPKFGSIGIGFAVEEDWNTNLPSHIAPGQRKGPENRVPAHELLDHIGHNLGDHDVADEVLLRAIEMIQEAVEEDQE